MTDYTINQVGFEMNETALSRVNFTNKGKGINLLVWNVQGAKAFMNILKEHIRLYEPHVIALYLRLILVEVELMKFVIDSILEASFVSKHKGFKVEFGYSVIYKR